MREGNFNFKVAADWLENLRLDLFLGRSCTPEFDTTGWLADWLDGAHTQTQYPTLSLSLACLLALAALFAYVFLFVQHDDGPPRPRLRFPTQRL